MTVWAKVMTLAACDALLFFITIRQIHQTTALWAQTILYLFLVVNLVWSLVIVTTFE